MDFNEIIKNTLLDELRDFDGRDLHVAETVASLKSAVMITLVDIQDQYPSFDATAEMKYDPINHEPIITVRWWETPEDVTLTLLEPVSTIHLMFNPLRIDRSKEDLKRAFEYAMSIV